MAYHSAIKTNEARIYTCMYNWVTMLYSRKLTEPYKPTTMEKRKIIIYKKSLYILKKRLVKQEFPDGLGVKNLVLSLLWQGFNPHTTGMAKKKK